MIQLKQNISLLQYNTFRVDVKAKFFCRVSSIEELQELIQSSTYQGESRLMMGAGSNILFTRDFPGLIIKMEITGKDLILDKDDRVMIKAGAGESWHELVMYCVQHDWGGLENLSLIPGTVGAAPIQNIGAYGVEIAELVEKVEGVDRITGAVRSFNKEECRFEYRESTFKRDLKEKYFISSVTLSLSKKNHLFNIQYGAIQDTLKQHHVGELSVKAVSDAVIEIRKGKLPDHNKIGNAGSFFKNPIISVEHYTSLQEHFPSIPSYPIDSQSVKIPAGWLIEQCGWKGKRIDKIGVHPHQALVLVNYGGAFGAEILALANQIQTAVKEKFDVSLTPEVNIF